MAVGESYVRSRCSYDSADSVDDEIGLAEGRHHHVRAVVGDHMHAVGRLVSEITLHCEPGFCEPAIDLR